MYVPSFTLNNLVILTLFFTKLPDKGSLHPREYQAEVLLSIKTIPVP
jgi:hypothetical protein